MALEEEEEEEKGKKSFKNLPRSSGISKRIPKESRTECERQMTH